MSLKAFHVFFISVSILTAFGFGVWGISSHFAQPNVWYLLMGVVSVVIGVALIVYGVYFLQKFKHLKYL